MAVRICMLFGRGPPLIVSVCQPRRLSAFLAANESSSCERTWVAHPEKTIRKTTAAQARQTAESGFSEVFTEMASVLKPAIAETFPVSRNLLMILRLCCSWFPVPRWRGSCVVGCFGHAFVQDNSLFAPDCNGRRGGSGGSSICRSATARLQHLRPRSGAGRCLRTQGTPWRN